MEMTPIESSAFRAAGYDPATKTMRLEFRSGGSHDFAEVPAEKFAEFLAADSKGRHYHANIRTQHTSQKVD